MFRKLLVAAGAAGLALAATPASAATTTVTCGYSGLQSGLQTKVCAEVTGDQVQLYGQISLAGPPSPGTQLQPKDLIVNLAGEIVGGASLGSVQGYRTFTASTIQVRGVGGTVPCGATVHASFSVSSYPWFNTPVTLDLPIAC
ncbi:hypothetical protein F4556_005351 [Kitasatospora gansuensis]|uniref:Uncharacterized protein n=1 Tax=Kitasatospora gansuensis TaxID=258050 RepID=A0A7W7WJZ2_9ACTN|nr:hypothetical protein [Kitasatospora gansuensis]MBB4949816.1 hypothetical protein [Kitasatospora gansuensis]